MKLRSSEKREDEEAQNREIKRAQENNEKREQTEK